MRAKLGILFMSLGTVLLVLALSLFLHNEAEADRARRATVNLLPQLIQQIQEPEEGEEAPPEETMPLILPGTPIDFLDPVVFEMKTVEIDGNDYIGYLSIPDLGLDLPIMSDWSYGKLQTAPCRYTGSLMSEDLVIMAHNYARHFGKLKDLPAGSRVYFTDVDGIVTEYETYAVEILPPTAVEEMVAGDFDMTLFTCTYGGASRVTVRCDRVKE